MSAEAPQTPAKAPAREPDGLSVLGGPVGIALGSGGACGFAHVGVLRALADAGIRPDVVCGTSSLAGLGVGSPKGGEQR